MPVTLLTSNVSKQRPVEPEFIKTTIEEEIANLEDKATFVEKVSSKLGKKSSNHKFIVLLTVLKCGQDVGTGVDIELSVGAIWEADKDGNVSFQVRQDDSEKPAIVTVFWISVD